MAEYEAQTSAADSSVTTLTLISSEMVPAFITGVMAYGTSAVFFYSYQMAIDTITLCFLEEKKGIDNAVDAGQLVEHVGPKSLIDFMKKNKRLKKAAKSKAEAENHGEEDKEEVQANAA